MAEEKTEKRGGVPKGMETLYNTGLNEDEAKEVNKWVMISFLVFITFAVIAHALVWSWRPWFDASSSSLIEAAQTLSQTMVG